MASGIQLPLMAIRRMRIHKDETHLRMIHYGIPMIDELREDHMIVRDDDKKLLIRKLLDKLWQIELVLDKIKTLLAMIIDIEIKAAAILLLYHALPGKR